jgi:hypothetical protein
VDGHVLRLARMERDSLEPGEGTDGHRHRRRGWGADVNLRAPRRPSRSLSSSP